MDSSTQITIMIGAMVLIFALAPFIGKRTVGRMLNGSAAKQAEGKLLMETGSKGKAMVMSLTPTGTIINRVQVECEIAFRIEPLSGGASFEGTKTAFIPQTRFPRVGDVWPCWFDAADTSRFTVGMPNLADPDAQAVLKDFDIANPLTSNATTMVAGSEAEAIAHLSNLRAQGILDDAQYESAAKQLLDR